MTLAEISKALGISVARVAQIERMALAKLSHPRNLEKWREIIQTIAQIDELKAKRGSLSQQIRMDYDKRS